MEAIDLRKAVVPKSDQLNADDLLDCSKDITVTGVSLNLSEDQKVTVHYEGDDGRPYKPCKSMCRVLIAAWGGNPEPWSGRSMRLFCDPSVRFGKDQVGGIRISHLTDIDGPKSYMLTVTRGKKREYKVKPMDRPERKPYSAELFAKKLPTILAWIESGDGTPEQAIARLEKEGALSEQQRAEIRGK